MYLNLCVCAWPPRKASMPKALCARMKTGDFCFRHPGLFSDFWGGCRASHAYQAAFPHSGVTMYFPTKPSITHYERRGTQFYLSSLAIVTSRMRKFVAALSETERAELAMQ